MNDTVIKVENLSKSYLIGHQSQEKYLALRDVIASKAKTLGRRLMHPFNSCTGGLITADETEEFWALKDINFEVKRGDRVGIIGRNGAGKSTLLKILSRITEPTSGRVEIDGRVASLLEVGTGFHPELTGRENIFLNGAILGMSRIEVKRKFDEIVDFAEVERFLDTPVKRYSSGMYVRLAFAVAAHLEPEILIVDEVLAVGDAQFQKKCLGKMEEVGKEGRTVLFVSHNIGAVAKLCNMGILLNSGTVIERGDISEVTRIYLATAYNDKPIKFFNEDKSLKAQILRVRVFDSNNIDKKEFSCGDEPVVEVSFIFRDALKGCHVACILTNAEGYHVFSTADADTDASILEKIRMGHYVVRVRLPVSNLNVGIYQVIIGIGVPGGEIYDRQETVSFRIHDTGDFGAMREGSRRAGLLLVQTPWSYL